MEILDPAFACLTNYEVLAFLSSNEEIQRYQTHQQHQQMSQQQQRSMRDRPTMTEAAASQYPWSTIKLRSAVLSNLLKSPAAVQHSHSIAAFLSRLTEFTESTSVKFTPVEIISLVNLRPTSAVEIHCLIEECDERMTEANRDALLEMILHQLPAPPVTMAEADIPLENM